MSKAFQNDMMKFASCFAEFLDPCRRYDNIELYYEAPGVGKTFSVSYHERWHRHQSSSIKSTQSLASSVKKLLWFGKDRNINAMWLPVEPVQPRAAERPASATKGPKAHRRCRTKSSGYTSLDRSPCDRTTGRQSRHQCPCQCKR